MEKRRRANKGVILSVARNLARILRFAQDDKIVLILLFLIVSPSVSFSQEGIAPGAVRATEALEGPDNITLDFKEADINTVLRVLSIKSNVNIVAGPEVQGTVTIRLENVPWEKALDVVLRTYDYVYERDGNIIRVTTRDKMAQEPVVTQTFILNYTKASEIKDAVQDMLTERGRIKTAERTNGLVITDIPTNLYRISEIVKKLDKVTPQAFIDSKIVRTDVGATENLGIAWAVNTSLSGSSRPTTFPFSTDTEDQIGALSPAIDQFFPLVPSGTISTATANSDDFRAFPRPATTANATYAFGTLDFSSFTSTLQMLQSKSNTKVVSNPRIVVLNNQTAKVQVGSQIPLPTFERNETTGSVEVTGFTYRDVGVVLDVTPHINSEEEILVDLKPEVSSKQAANINFGEFQAPAFDVTTATTQVLIRSGETIAIGGLLTDNAGLTEARIPYLADIPILGKLFRSKRQDAGSTNTKTETLFFVTVSMVDTEGQPTGEQVRKKSERHKNLPAKTPRQQKVETLDQNKAAAVPTAETKSPEAAPALTGIQPAQAVQTPATPSAPGPQKTPS